MNRKRLFVIASLLFLMPLAVHAEEHDGQKSEKPAKTPRKTAQKKKPSTLAEKISACLAERPKNAGQKPNSTKPPEGSGTQDSSVPQPSAATKTSGVALVQKFCIECHSSAELDGNRGLAASKISAGLMPKPGHPQPSAEEKQALIDYFSGAK